MLLMSRVLGFGRRVVVRLEVLVLLRYQLRMLLLPRCVLGIALQAGLILVSTFNITEPRQLIRRGYLRLPEVFVVQRVGRRDSLGGVHRQHLTEQIGGDRWEFVEPR